ncbi:hypothetical protein SGRI78S_03328 [Streptomyces griseus subsp. griseus]
MSTPACGVSRSGPPRPSCQTTLSSTTNAVTSLSGDRVSSGTTSGVPVPLRGRMRRPWPPLPFRENQLTFIWVMRKLLASPVTGSGFTRPSYAVRMP